MCCLTVTSLGNPAEGMGDCFHVHCQAPCLTVKPHPDWSISVHYELLRFAVTLTLFTTMINQRRTVQEEIPVISSRVQVLTRVSTSMIV